MPKGRFIVLEGIDGSGTTVQSNILTNTLNSNNVDTHRTAEPSTGAIGKLIREIIGGKTFTYLNSMDPERLKVILALLFTADRADHAWTELEPQWKQGVVTVCDRYSLSTFAYELGVLTDRQWIQEIGRSLPTPDLTIYLRLSAEQAFDRLLKRWEEKGDGGSKPEIFEKIEVQKKLVSNYDAFCGLLHANETFVEKNNVVVVDASLSIEEVAVQILGVTMNHLRKWRLV